MQKLMKTLFTIAMLFVAGCTPLIDRGVKKTCHLFLSSRDNRSGYKTYS